MFSRFLTNYGKVQARRHSWLFNWENIMLLFSLAIIYGYLQDKSFSLATTKSLTKPLGLILGCALIGVFAVILYEFMMEEQKKVPKTSDNEPSNKLLLHIVEFLFGTEIVQVIVNAFAMRLFPVSHSSMGLNQKTIMQIMGNGIDSKIWMLFLAVIAGPIIEEFLCRFMIIGPKTMLNHTYSTLSRAIGGTISVILFTLLHISVSLTEMNWSSTNDIHLLILQTIPYIIMSIAFMIIYMKSSDIRESIGVHMGVNLISLLGMSILF